MIMAVRHLLQKLADTIMRHIPRTPPPPERLADCRIVAHRGAHNNPTIVENTLPAFDRAYEAGVWGIEFDVRWTADGQPVVAHDADLKRLFNLPVFISRLSRDALKTCCPAIPDLGTVVDRYGGRLHLMVELKTETVPEPAVQERVLLKTFSGLLPCRDYHFMSLEPEAFDRFPGLPRKALLPISFGRLNSFSNWTLQKGYGGVTGHYLLVTRRIMARHHRRQQRVGTGFIASPPILYREVNRGVDWLFSDCALDLQRHVNRAHAEARVSA
jgi:glycerophosphoryl diester phosphodiesterase